MNLVIFSYKRVWRDPSAAAGYLTAGGFPMQVAALSEIFSGTRVVVPENRDPPPPGLVPLEGHRLEVVAVPEPPGTGLRRKIALPLWLLRNGGLLWRECGAAEAVHALVPGDLGTLGLLVALLRRKLLLVRHCGTWGNRETLADRFLAWLLPRIAGGRRVVLATGGDDGPPAGTGGRVSWIFSTSLRQQQMEALAGPERWTREKALQLVTVGRLTEGKNAAAALEALPEIRRRRPGANLHLVGHGPAAPALRRRVTELGLEEAVVLHGNLPHDRVLEVLRRCHLFVFPTRVAEGFPKAVIEAMACGLPILAPPVSVLPRLIEGGCGWLLADTEAATVAAAVIDATADAGALAERGAEARRRARRYTLEGWQLEIRRILEAAWETSLETPAGDPRRSPG